MVGKSRRPSLPQSLLMLLLSLLFLILLGGLSSAQEHLQASGVAPFLDPDLLPAQTEFPAYRGVQVAPSLVFHNWSDSVLVVWGEGYETRADMLLSIRFARLGAQTPFALDFTTVVSDLLPPPDRVCLRRPRLAFARDLQTLVLAIETCLGEPRVWTSTTLGRQWVAASVHGQYSPTYEQLHVLEANRHTETGLYMLTSTGVGYVLRASQDGGRTWYPTHAGTIFEAGAQAYPRTGEAWTGSLLQDGVVDGQAQEHYLVIITCNGTRLWSPNGGRSFSPVPDVSGSIEWSPSAMTVWDSERQPFAYDARLGGNAVIKRNYTARLRLNLGAVRAIDAVPGNLLGVRLFNDERYSLAGAPQVCPVIFSLPLSLEPA